MAQNDEIEVFQELKIITKISDSKYFRDTLIRNSSPPWHYDFKREGESSPGYSGDVFLYFERQEDNIKDFPKSILYIWQSPTGYDLTNITPKDSGRLTITQYNNILSDFLDFVVTPASKNHDFTVELSKDRNGLLDWLDTDTADALKRFSRSTNKSTGTGHPSDARMWRDFLIKAHSSRGNFDPQKLIRWLTEIDNWPDDWAHDLAVQYEQGMDLLEEYDNRHL